MSKLVSIFCSLKIPFVPGELRTVTSFITVLVQRPAVKVPVCVSLPETQSKFPSKTKSPSNKRNVLGDIRSETKNLRNCSNLKKYIKGTSIIIIV